MLLGLNWRSWEYDDLKKDFESMRTSHDAVVKENAEVEKIDCAELQRVQDSLRKKLAELRCDIEASVEGVLSHHRRFFVWLSGVVPGWVCGDAHRLCGV
jgi:transposase-like protein